MMRYIIGIYIYIGIIYCVYGQTENSLPIKYKFNKISVEEGLPNSQINDIIQDIYGFIWIATMDGLCRYDGQNFIKYRHNPKISSSIPSNTIQKLYIDNEGKLWILTSEGASWFNSEFESFENIQSDNSRLNENDVNSIVQTSDSTYYIGTAGGGVNIYKNQKFDYLLQGNEAGNLSSQYIQTLSIQNDSLIWIGTDDKGLNVYNRFTGLVKQFKYGIKEQVLSPNIRDIFIDSKNFVWVATNRGISVFDNHAHFLFTISFNDIDGLQGSIFDVLSICEDKKGNIWIGSRDSGLLKASRNNIIQNRGKTNYQIFKPKEDGESVYYRSISSIFQDNQGNIWLGTHGMGVNVFHPDGEIIRYLFNQPGNQSSLSHKKVWGICEDTFGKLWIGTDGGGINVYNPKDGQIKYYQHDKNDFQSLSDDAILSALKDKNNRLWFGTYRGGLCRYIPETDKFKHYNTENTQLKSNDIRVIFEDRQGRLWVGTNGGGLSLYNQQKDSFSYIDVIGNVDIRSILQLKDGALIIGTYNNGLFYYHPDKKLFKKAFENSELNNQIKRVFALSLTTDDNLWIGTGLKGLIYYNLKTNAFKIFDESNGLINNYVHSIIHKNGYLWISTNQGISSLELKTHQIVNFDHNYGFQPSEFNDNSALLSSKGYLCFGGNKGINIFYPEELLNQKVSTEVIITDFKVLDKSIGLYNQKGKPGFRPNINYKQINLKYYESVFTIHFSTLKLPFAPKQKIAFMLENYDQKWTISEGNYSVTYRNIPAGYYTFKIKVANNKGEWGKTLTLTIEISPPFWKTSQAIFLYCLLGFIIFIVVMYFYTKQIKLKSKLDYEIQLLNKEKEIHKNQLSFFTNISHELKTPLTLIIGHVNDMTKDVKIQKPLLRKLNVVRKNSFQLLDFMNQLLEFRKIQTGLGMLDIAEYELDYIIQGVFENFISQAENKNIDFKFKKQFSCGKVWIDRHKFIIVLNNLLSNAFKFTPFSGNIEIGIVEEKYQLILYVKDNGSGISSENLGDIFECFVQQRKYTSEGGVGIGLALVKNIIDLHLAKISVFSKEEEGTIFEIYIPKGNEHLTSLKYINFLSGNYLPENNNINYKNPSEEITQITSEELFSEEKLHQEKVILLVDDNEDILDYLSDIFIEEFNILVAKDGDEGIRLAQGYSPDLIISDLMMPMKDGLDLCKELRDDIRTSHIPIIFLTANESLESKMKSLSEGINDYITKPFDAEFLKIKVYNLFDYQKRLLNHYNIESIYDLENYADNKEQKFLNTFKKLILDHIDEKEILIPNLAYDLGLSRTSLYRKIKALTGKNINHFIRDIRLKKAAELMIKENMNVSEAAFYVSFNDLKYFRSCFKEQFNLTPSEYKAKYNQSKIES